MKLSENYMLDNVADTPVAIPCGQNVADFCNIVQLSESAAFICESLSEEKTLDELKALLYEKYLPDNDSEKEIINNDLDEFLEIAIAKGIIEK